MPLPALCTSRVDAWPVVHQTFSVTVALGGLLRGREGRPLSWAPSADAVAGGMGSRGDPQTTAWGIAAARVPPCICTTRHATVQGYLGQAFR